MAPVLPLVLVPGLLCSARLYAPQIAALWQFGPVMLANHIRDDHMGAIARRILAEAPPRFALAGHSMGGYIAFEIMRQAPDRVAKLALINTQARPDTPEAVERALALMRVFGAPVGYLVDGGGWGDMTLTAAAARAGIRHMSTELAGGGQSLERLAFQNAALAQVVEDARLEAEEAAVDPALDPRLLMEAADPVPVV